MSITPIDWPPLLRPTDFGYHPVNFDVSGGAAPDGSEQIVASPSPSWRASMTLSVQRKEEVLALRALRTQTKGRAIPVLLPNFDGQRLSWPPQMFNGAPTGIVLSPDAARDPRLDGTAYADPEIPDESEIVAKLDADAALRATTIAIVVSQGGEILPGQQFGIAQRLHELGTVVTGDTDGDGTHYTVTFQPPLRAAASDGDDVLFTRPLCLMRCLNLNDEMKKLELLRFATLNLEFAEYI